jgi:hypothetical protein
MSILNCYTRLTIVNCTGLPATFHLNPSESTMRIQPVGNANVNAVIGTTAETIVDWFKEWFQLLSYGPTYQTMAWHISPSTTETVRFQLTSSLNVSVHWGDPSVAWDNYSDGLWNVDISKATDVTMFFKSDMGELGKQSGQNGSASVQLLPYLEIACDNDIPFVIKTPPIASMFWRPGINMDNIVNPTNPTVMENPV